MMKTLKLLLKIGKLTFIGILIGILALSVTVIAKRVVLKEQLPLVLNYGLAVVITGSMEPTIAPGDVVLIHKQQDYHVGEIVIYQANAPIAHRIIEKTVNGYVTQGDANNAPDSEINKSQVIGKVVFIISKAGYIILFLQQPLHLFLLLIILIAVIEVPRLLRNRSPVSSKTEDSQ